MSRAYGLPEILTHQTVFETVATHLIEQGRPATTNNGNCRYRMDGGSIACAVGCLIPDERYTPEMENKGPAHPVFRKAMPELDPYTSMIDTLQETHDSGFYWSRSPMIGSRTFDLDKLRRRLREIAEANNLTIPAIIQEPTPAPAFT